MWISYCLLSLGFRSVDNDKTLVNCDYNLIFNGIQDWGFIKCLLNLVVCWICTVLSAKFYTGKGPAAVFSSFLGAGNSYNDYQAFFNSSNIASMGIAKIPYVIMLTFLVFQLCASFLSILLSSKQIKIYQYAYLLLLAMAYYYFGSSRGTNFEAYLLFILIAYCLLVRSMKGFYKIEYRKLLLILLLIFLLGIVMIFVYRKVVENRGVHFNYDICPEIVFIRTRLISKLMPTLLAIATSIFSYLGYGIFAIGVTFSDLIFKSVSVSIFSLLPKGNEILAGSTLNFALRDTIDVNVRWVPDYINFIDLFGLLGFFIITYFVGRFMASYQKKHVPTVVSNVMNFLIFVEMLSLPVGNFLLSSTPNKLLLLTTIFVTLICSFLCDRTKIREERTNV